MSTETKSKRKYGATFKEISLGEYFNWPSGKIAGKWNKDLAEHVRSFSTGKQAAQGIPFHMAEGARRVILAAASRKEVTIPLAGRANHRGTREFRGGAGYVGAGTCGGLRAISPMAAHGRCESESSGRAALPANSGELQALGGRVGDRR